MKKAKIEQDIYLIYKLGYICTILTLNNKNELVSSEGSVVELFDPYGFKLKHNTKVGIWHASSFMYLAIASYKCKELDILKKKPLYKLMCETL